VSLTSFGSFGRQKDEGGPAFDFAAIFTKFLDNWLISLLPCIHLVDLLSFLLRGKMPPTNSLLQVVRKNLIYRALPKLGSTPGDAAHQSQDSFDQVSY
jgi:hypothetical protein